MQLRSTPPAEWFYTHESLSKTRHFFPLEIFYCKSCSHIQSLDVLDSKVLFQNYFYTSESSPGLSIHFKNYANELIERFNLDQESLVVDIGSNDGTLLHYLQLSKINVVGIEPSLELTQLANNRGVPTLNSFIDAATVKEVLHRFGAADVVTANNVFAHHDDLAGMAARISELLKPGGQFVFEVSSFGHLLQNKIFDYVYHEHLSHHSLKPLISFLKKFEMFVVDVQITMSKGGSLRVYSQKGTNKSNMTVSKEINRVIKWESDTGVYDLDKLKTFQKEIEGVGKKVRDYLEKNKTKRIIGYGASATTTTLLYNFEIIFFLERLVDDNPVRHGSFLPGSTLQVLSPDLIRTPETVEIVFICAWRHWKDIADRCLLLFPDAEILIPLPQPHTVKKIKGKLIKTFL
jgi:SAM-dependent methyltransferase